MTTAVTATASTVTMPQIAIATEGMTIREIAPIVDGVNGSGGGAREPAAESPLSPRQALPTTNWEGAAAAAVAQ